MSDNFDVGDTVWILDEPEAPDMYMVYIPATLRAAQITLSHKVIGDDNQLFIVDSDFSRPIREDLLYKTKDLAAKAAIAELSAKLGELDFVRRAIQDAIKGFEWSLSNDR